MLVLILRSLLVFTPLVGTIVFADHADIKTTKILKPKEVHEECLRIGAGQKLAYSFSSESAINFNIHYHVANEIYYPVKKDGVREHKDLFSAKSSQDYCLMWTNAGSQQDTVKYEFQLENP